MIMMMNLKKFLFVFELMICYSCVTGYLNAVVLCHHYRYQCRSVKLPSLSAGTGDNGNYDSMSNVNSGNTINLIIDNRKNKADNRESLPFSVVEIVKKGKDNGTKEIGTYLLDSTTSCGDILELGDKGVFKVKRVRFLYNYVNGKFRVFKKKIDVTSTRPMYAPSGYEAKDIFQ